MNSLRISAMAATLLFALGGAAFAASKPASLMPQSGKQPHSLMTSKKSLVKAKHNFLATAGDKKVRPAGKGLMAGGASGPNHK